MKSFFEKRDLWGHGMALWVLVAMIFLAPLAVHSLKRIDLHNDIENWLPSDDPQAMALRWYHDHFQQEERMLVSWEGSSMNDPRVAQFAKRLEGITDENGIRRNGMKQIERVRTPQQLYARMIKSDIEPEDALERLEGVLIGTGKLKVQLTDAGRGQKKSLIRKLTKQADELGLKIEISEPFIEWVETSEFTADSEEEDVIDESLADIEMPTVPEHDFQISWAGQYPETEVVDNFRELANEIRGLPTADEKEGVVLIEDIFFAPGSPVALSLALSEAGTADKSGTIRLIRQTAAEVGIDPDKFHMGGRPVAGSALNQAVKAAAWNRAYPISQFHKRSPILLSGAVGILLAFIMLRSFRLATLVQVVSYYTVLMAVALVPITGGSMNMVLVVMPTLLLVLTTSGAIHVCNYWKHAAHHDMRTAVVEATNMARKPCFLASLTTAIGLMSLTTSPLAPVRDFGFYSAIGCMISVVLVLYGLPTLLLYWPSKRPSEKEVDRSNWIALGNFLSEYKTFVTVTSLLVFAVSVYGLNWFQTETKAIRYFPEDSQVVRDYRFLEENLAGIIPVELIIRFDKNSQDPINGMSFYERMEVVREIENKIRQNSAISGAISLADFIEQPDERPKSTGIQNLLYMRKSREVERRVKENSQHGAKSYITVATTPADLHKAGDNGLNGANDELWRITAQVAIMSNVDYGQLTADMDRDAKTILRYHAGTAHVVTGMVPVFLRTQQAVLDSLIRSFILAFAVIAVVMVILLRNPVAGVITMIPNLLPVGVVFGLISWNGLRVDIGTMITASVALGIAVDGTLHLLTWFRQGIAQGKERQQAVAEALAHCGPAMWQTSTAVGIGLLVLYPADLLLISRFGWLMAALIGAAMVADIIVLPALLAGPLGSLIEKSTPLVTDEANPTNLDASQTADPPEHHLESVSRKSGKALRVD